LTKILESQIETPDIDDVIDASLSIIDSFGLTMDEFVNKWESYALNHSIIHFSSQDMANLRVHIQKSLNNSFIKKTPTKRTFDKVYTKDTIKEYIIYFY